MKNLIKKVAHFSKLALAHLAEKLSIPSLIASLCVTAYFVYLYYANTGIDEHWSVYVKDEAKDLSLLYAICASMTAILVSTAVLHWSARVLKREYW